MEKPKLIRALIDVIAAQILKGMLILGIPARLEHELGRVLIN